MATTSKWEGLIITTSTTTIISYKSITTYVYYYYYNVSVAITYITDTISTIVILLLVKLNFYFYCPYVYLLDLLEHNVKVPQWSIKQGRTGFQKHFLLVWRDVMSTFSLIQIETLIFDCCCCHCCCKIWHLLRVCCCKRWC